MSRILMSGFLLFTGSVYAADPAPTGLPQTIVPQPVSVTPPVPAPAVSTPAPNLPGTLVPTDHVSGAAPAAMHAPLRVYPDLSSCSTGNCDPCNSHDSNLRSRLKGYFGFTGLSSECSSCAIPASTNGRVIPALVPGQFIHRLPVTSNLIQRAPAACTTGDCNTRPDRSRWERMKEWFCWRPSEGNGLPLLQPAPYHAPALSYFRRCSEPSYAGSTCATAAGVQGCGPKGCAVQSEVNVPNRPAFAGSLPATPNVARETAVPNPIVMTKSTAGPASSSTMIRSPYDRFVEKSFPRVSGPLGAALQHAQPETTVAPLITPATPAKSQERALSPAAPFSNP